MKDVLFAIGLFLMFVTTALELQAWWESNQSQKERIRSGMVVLLNIAALILVVATR